MEEKTTAKKVMLSGIQPSGDLHLGNYLGAIKTWAARAEQYDCYYFMADMHTITVRQTPTALRRRTLEQLEHPVRAESCTCPRSAGLGAGLLHHVR